MAIPYLADLQYLLSQDDFGVAATYSGATIYGHFDNETVPLDAGGTALVHQEQPRFKCRTSDVSSVASNDTIEIDSVTYNIVAWIHDGTGVTDLHLEKP